MERAFKSVVTTAAASGAFVKKSLLAVVYLREIPLFRLYYGPIKTLLRPLSRLCYGPIKPLLRLS
jgi:hypothetical protein